MLNNRGRGRGRSSKLSERVSELGGPTRPVVGETNLPATSSWLQSLRTRDVTPSGSIPFPPSFQTFALTSTVEQHSQNDVPENQRTALGYPSNSFHVTSKDEQSNVRDHTNTVHNSQHPSLTSGNSLHTYSQQGRGRARSSQLLRRACELGGPTRPVIDQTNQLATSSLLIRDVKPSGSIPSPPSFQISVPTSTVELHAQNDDHNNRRTTLVCRASNNFNVASEAEQCEAKELTNTESNSQQLPLKTSNSLGTYSQQGRGRARDSQVLRRACYLGGTINPVIFETNQLAAKSLLTRDVKPSGSRPIPPSFQISVPMSAVEQSSQNDRPDDQRTTLGCQTSNSFNVTMKAEQSEYTNAVPNSQQSSLQSSTFFRTYSHQSWTKVRKSEQSGPAGDLDRPISPVVDPTNELTKPSWLKSLLNRDVKPSGTIPVLPSLQMFALTSTVEQHSQNDVPENQRTALGCPSNSFHLTSKDEQCDAKELTKTFPISLQPSLKPGNFLRTYSQQQEKTRYPGGYFPSKKHLPQVSSNRSKNDMSTSKRLEPGKPNEFWGDPVTTINLMETVCQNVDDWEDLINFRRCCSTFASIGIQELRKRFACRITKRFALYFWQTFKDYPPEEIPFTQYQLTPKWMIKSPVNMEAEHSKSCNTDDIMQNILRLIGYYLTFLRLEEFSITGGLSTLRNLLFEYAPNMTELIFIQPEFFQNQTFCEEMKNNGGQMFHPDVGSYIPKLASLPSINFPRLSRPRLTRFEYHAKSNTWFPLLWAEVFLGFPNLRELSVKNLGGWEMTELVAALTSDVLESTLPLQKLNMFYTSFCPARPRHDDGILVTNLLPLYQQLPFKLTELDIHLKPCFSIKQLQEVLTVFSESLVSLTLTREPEMSGFQFSTLFDHKLFFPNLTSFWCTNDILNSLDFLNIMPALEQLKMCETDPTERFSKTIFSLLFQKTNFQALGELNLKVFYLSKCLDFPSIVDKQVVENELKNSFRNLRTLRVCLLDNMGLRIICGQLSTLRELTIVGPHLGVTDEGIIGFDGLEKIARFAVKMKEVEELNEKIRQNSDSVGQLMTIKRDFPYVGDLMYLRSFVLDNEVIVINITELSLKYGFSDCELLNNLELYCTKISESNVEQWKHPPSIVSVSLKKGLGNRYVGLIPKSKRVTSTY